METPDLEVIQIRTRPNARTWTLATLDRGQTYRLFFNEEDWRWDIAFEATGEVVVTRETRQTRRAAAGAPDCGAEGYAGARRAGEALGYSDAPGSPTPRD